MELIHFSNNHVVKIKYQNALSQEFLAFKNHGPMAVIFNTEETNS